MEEEFEIEMDFPDEESAQAYCDIRNDTSPITGLHYFVRNFLIPDPEVVKFLNSPDKHLENMPEWKRGALEASMRPCNSEPREPQI
jgi:hypothetical protein